MRLRFLSHALPIVASIFWGQASVAQMLEAPALEANIDGVVETLGLRIDRDAMTGAPPEVWSEVITKHSADYIRLYLRVEGGGFPEDAFLRLSSGLGQRFDIKLSDIGAKGGWSPILPFGRAQMALVSSMVPSGAALIIDNIAVQNVKGSLYSPYGPNDLKYINAEDVPTLFRSFAPSVAILYFVKGGKPRTCTGFLIEADLMLTNEHCINDKATCTSMTAVFGYEYGEDGRLRMGPQIGCAGYEKGLSIFSLDATAVRLKSPPGPEFGTVDVSLAVGLPYDDLVVIQHPGSQPKQISFVDCRSVALKVDGRDLKTDFTHTCDTARGSSGAPIFTRDGRLAGLHHFGFQEGGGGEWRENRGVHADLIAGWIDSFSDQ